jgi:hypothetical protein
MKKMTLEEAVRIMTESNLKVPLDLKIRILDEQQSQNGTVVQVWVCKKCPGWRHQASIRALSVTCTKGHDATIMWDKDLSSLAGT